MFARHIIHVLLYSIFLAVGGGALASECLKTGVMQLSLTAAQISDDRMDHGVDLLIPSGALTLAAQEVSCRIAKGTVIRQPGDVVKTTRRSGYDGVRLAYLTSTASTDINKVIAAWMADPQSRAVLRYSKFRDYGIARSVDDRGVVHWIAILGHGRKTR